jgi:hypothetical protein
MSVPIPPYHKTINKLLHAILQYFRGEPETMTVPLPPYYNVTNDLLYAILNTVNAGVPPVAYTQFRILYVSARYGNNGTALPNNMARPYKTITAAKNNAFFGDIIHVMEGIYDEGNLFGSYYYWFDFGAQINYTGAGAIFQRWFGECIVRGLGKFRSAANNCVADVGGWFHCFLDMECESIEAEGQATMFWQNIFVGGSLYKPHRIKCRRIYSSGGPAAMFRSYCHATIQADEIVSDSFTDAPVWIGGVFEGLISNSKIISNNFVPVNCLGLATKVTFDNCSIVNNFNSAQGHGIYTTWHITDLVLYNTRIYCKNINANSINTVSDINLYLDSNVNANTDTGGAGILNYVNKNTKIQLTNNEAVIDLTGLTSLDLSPYQNAEIIRISSANPSETLSEINFAPKHHGFRVLASPGLMLTITSTDPMLAIDNSIVLETASLTLNGDKGDWIEFRNGLYGQGNRQINASNY